MTDATSGQETLAFDLIGGEARVRELVDRFYDLMDLEPEFAVLRALHPLADAGLLRVAMDDTRWLIVLLDAGRALPHFTA